MRFKLFYPQLNFTLLFSYLIIYLSQLFFVYTYDFLLFFGPLLVLSIIFTVGKKYFRNQILDWIGLSWNRSQLFIFFIFFLITYLGANFLILDIGYTIKSYKEFSLYIFIFLQTLTEDIVFGLFMIRALENIKIQKNIIGCLVLFAILFSLLHLLLYAHPFRYRSDYLSLAAMTGLALFGYYRFRVMFLFKNICLAWGIHLGFNMFFFSHKIMKNNVALKEHEMFNHILSLPVILILLVFMILSVEIYHSFRARRLLNY